MAHFTVSYEGRLRCRLVHTASGTQVATDAPVDNRGRGESFSPTDLVASATAACMLTIMGIRAQDAGIDLDGARVDVDKHMVADPLRRIGRLDLTFALPGAPDRAQRAMLEEAALSCPVKVTLSERVELRVHFGWGEAGP